MSEHNQEETSFSSLLADIISQLVLLFVSVIYWLFKKDYYNRHHLEVQFENGTLGINWYNHNEYVEQVKAKLTTLWQDLPPKEFVKEAFFECRHCNYIIFNCGDDDLFIQFWLADNNLRAHWPLMDTNKLQPYTLEMLGVLNLLGISNHPRKIVEPSAHYYQFFDLKKGEEFDEYEITFGQDAETAAEFVAMMFQDVFGQSINHLSYKVG